MAVSVSGVIGEADVTSSDTLVIPLISPAPQSTPTVSQVIYLAVVYSPGGFGGWDVSDNSTQSEAPYEGPNGAFADAPAYGGPVNVGIGGYYILKPLLAGDEITLTFGATLDYIHAVAVLVEGMETGGSCDGAGNPGEVDDLGDGGSLRYIGGGVYSEPVTIDPTAEIGLYVCGQSQDASADLSFTDPAVNLLTSWTNQGPNNDSGIVGWIGTSGTGPYDPAPTTDDPPANEDAVGFAAVWLAPGAGPAYCTSVGIPVFNHRFRAGAEGD